MEFFKWLKRIFTVNTVSLIVGIASLLIAYLAFIRESPGKMHFQSYVHKFSKKTQTIFFLIDVNKEAADFLKLEGTPFLANISQKTVQDCVTYFEMVTPFPFEVQENYSCKIDSSATEKNLIHAEMALRKETIGYMDGLFFPISKLYASSDEPVIIPINWMYIHKGMKKTVGYRVYLVTLPVGFVSDDEIESTYLRLIRPYLLEGDPKTSAIVYKNTVIEHPKVSTLKENYDIRKITFSDLK